MVVLGLVWGTLQRRGGGWKLCACGQRCTAPGIAAAAVKLWSCREGGGRSRRIAAAGVGWQNCACMVWMCAPRASTLVVECSVGIARARQYTGVSPYLCQVSTVSCCRHQKGSAVSLARSGVMFLALILMCD